MESTFFRRKKHFFELKFSYSKKKQYLCLLNMDYCMQKLLKYLLCVLLGVVCLSSCVTSRKVNYWQDPNKRIPAYSDTLSYEDYRLRKGDRLYIYVYSIDEKTSQLFNSGNTNMRQFVRSSSGTGSSDLYTYLVDADGNITFPTIGKLPVRGLTTREVKRELEEQLSGLVKTLGNQSMLSVEVQVIQRFFSVIGANSSGRFAINKEKVTIFEALAMAGDIADFGDRSNIKIVRELEDSTIVMNFDVRSKDIVNSEFYYVEPNDVIYIRKIKGQAFGINSASAAVSVVATTLSFGVFIYTFVDRCIQKAKANEKEENKGEGGTGTK